MSADKADEYLSDGMTEELLNALAKLKGLRVPGRSSSFAFKGRTAWAMTRRRWTVWKKPLKLVTVASPTCTIYPFGKTCVLTPRAQAILRKMNLVK